MDPFQKPKTAGSLVFWKGFADELAKIAMTPMMPTKPQTVMKSMAPKLGKFPNPVAMPRNIQTPPAMRDPLSSTKTMQPPPATA